MIQHLHPIPVRPTRVVILGASGFVAVTLARHLREAGIEFRAVGSGEVNLERVESVEQLAKILKPEDAVVMTSALTPDKGRDVGTLMRNLAMAQHVGAALERTGCSHFVYLSSDAVYDGRDSLIREGSARQPSDLYSLMHIAREQIVSFSTNKSKIPLCILCPCAIYGAGDTHNSYGPNRFFRMAMKDGKIAIFGEGKETRDHVYIEDVARLLVLCLMRRSVGLLNLVSGEPVTFGEVAGKVASLVGGVSVEHLPAGGAVTHRVFDVTERIKAFPEFSPMPLDEGLAETWSRLRAPHRG